MKSEEIEAMYSKLFDMCDEADACDDRFEAQALIGRVYAVLQGLDEETTLNQRIEAVSAVSARRFGL